MNWFTGLRTAVDPDHMVWEIKRVWLPRKSLFLAFKKYRENKAAKKKESSNGGDSSWYEFLDVPPAEGFFWALLIVIGTAAAIFISYFLVFPLLLLIFDLILTTVFMVVAIVTKVMFKRPWQIKAEDNSGRTIIRNVVGWHASKREIEILASDIKLGRLE